jgi:hypothetical protein
LRRCFELTELASILDAQPLGRTDPDEVPEPPVNPVAVRDDLWALGRHRLRKMFVGCLTGPIPT